MHVTASAATIMIVAAAFLAPAAHAIDPYRQNPNDRRTLEDPDRLSRPMTSTLKGAEIKEHRDKVNAVRNLVFREGRAPTAGFRALPGDKVGLAPTRFIAQGAMADFTPAVQSEVKAKLPAAPKPTDRVEVEVAIENDAVVVSAARVMPATRATARPGDVRPASAAPPRLPEVARPKPAAVTVPSLREAPAADASANGGDAPPAVVPPDEAPAAPERMSAAPAADEMAAPAAVAAPAFPSLPAAARALVAQPASPAPAGPTAAALIPLPDGGAPLVVRRERAPSGEARFVVSASAARLPEALKAQIRADQGPASLPSGETTVSVVVEIRADRSTRVVEVRSPLAAPKEAPAAAAPAAPSDAQAPAPAVSGGEAPSRPESPATASAAPAEPPAAPPDAAEPAGPDVPSPPDPFPEVTAAKTLAVRMGLDPAAVRLDAPAEASVKGPLQVPVDGGRHVVVEAAPSASGRPAAEVRARGRFGDLSTQTKREIREILGRFNAAPLVNDDSQVVVQARPADGDRFQIVSISVRNPEAPESEFIVVWREGDAGPVEPPPAAEGPVKTGGPDVEAPAAPPAQPPVRAAAPKGAGLAPSVAAIAEKAFGLPRQGFEIKPDGPKGGIKIDPVASGRSEVLLERTPAVREGPSRFESLGRTVDFSDAIREQVDAKLREAIENGETWADDALKGSRELRVTFEVDESAEGGPAVRVVDVAPTSADAARDAAEAMGLKNGEFFVVNVAGQSLIVLERGVSANVRVGDARVKIVSPDGDAKVFVNKHRAAKDASAVFMLSRDSLRANRAAIARAGGPAAEAAIEAALDENPRTGEYIIRIDPSAGADADKFVIKAMQGGAVDPSFVAGEKKPEEKP